MKIGITFEPTDSSVEIFSNGIKQNAIFFYDLLKNIGYDVHLIIPRDSVDKLLKIYGIKEDVQYLFYEDILNSNYNLVIQFTFQIDANALSILKSNGVKLILYKCGNDYVMDLEDTLFFPKKNKLPQYASLSKDLPIFNQVWLIPQHQNTNFYYWKTLYKCDVKVVPPVWSNSILHEFEKESINTGLGEFKYKPKFPEKKIAILEPNVNVVKWFFPPLLICENTYRKDKNKIKHVYITNIHKNNILNVDLTNDLVKSLDLYKDKKISIESRYNSLYFMSAHADICVSHQWENPLNYLYLDLAWYGWPIIHNANLCKDVGYYYDGFNYEDGAKVLESVIKNHDKNIDKYIEKNRKLIGRYLPTNKIIQETYIKLIDELFK